MIGLGICLVLLLFTFVVATGVGPELPGPHIREVLGISSPPLPDLCEYNPKEIFHPRGKPGPGYWRFEHNAPIPSPEAGATAVGKWVYMVGGQGREATEPTVLRFDPRTGEYRREPDAPVAIDHPVVTTHHGEVILASGYIDGSEPTNRMWAFSPRTRKWRELPPMRTARGAAAGAVVGDRLYVAGGTTVFGNENEPIHSFEIYDFDDRRWSRGPDMPTARHHFGVGVVDGRLYFAGGRQPDDLSLAAFEEFNPATGRWRRLPKLPVGLGSPAVTAADGMVIVTGGGEDRIHPYEPGGWETAASYGYEPGREHWIRLPDMRQARHGHSIAAIGDEVYVFRGIPCPGYGEMSTAESLQLRPKA
ncbi:MAG TPA: kelch repeat-containing protein [Solirubrobacterales bacterium]|nr:kelch repeat-containing protein [Solirubrobacterales bacterium]